MFLLSLHSCSALFVLCSRWHWTDAQYVRGLITAIQVEERVKFLLEWVHEGVDVTSWYCIIKWHLSFFKVHIHTYSLQPGGDRKNKRWGGGDSVFLSFLHSQCPIALSHAYGNAAFPVDRCSGNTQVPVILFTHLDLPVMAARSETFTAQGDDHCVKTLWCVRQVLPCPQVTQLSSVLRELQPRIGCVWIKGHIHFTKEKKRNLDGTRNHNIWQTFNLYGNAYTNRTWVLLNSL